MPAGFKKKFFNFFASIFGGGIFGGVDDRPKPNKTKTNPRQKCGPPYLRGTTTAVIMSGSGLNEGPGPAPVRAGMSADEKAKRVEVATRVIARLTSEYPGTPAYKVESLCGLEVDPKPNWM